MYDAQSGLPTRPPDGLSGSELRAAAALALGSWLLVAGVSLLPRLVGTLGS
jgi:hypothetical protein